MYIQECPCGSDCSSYRRPMLRALAHHHSLAEFSICTLDEKKKKTTQEQQQPFVESCVAAIIAATAWFSLSLTPYSLPSVLTTGLSGLIVSPDLGLLPIIWTVQYDVVNLGIYRGDKSLA